MTDDNIKGEARELRGKAESAAGRLAGDAKLKVDGAVDEIAGRAQSAYGRAKSAAREVTDQVADLGDGNSGLEAIIRRQPLTAAMVALGIGYVLGRLR